MNVASESIRSTRRVGDVVAPGYVHHGPLVLVERIKGRAVEVFHFDPTDGVQRLKEFKINDTTADEMPYGVALTPYGRFSLGKIREGRRTLTLHDRDGNKYPVDCDVTDGDGLLSLKDQRRSAYMAVQRAYLEQFGGAA